MAKSSQTNRRTGAARSGKYASRAPATLAGTTIAAPRGGGLPQAQARTEYLIATLGSGQAVADLLGVSRGQPSKWRTGQETPGPDASRQLIDLDHVLARAMMLWPADVAVDWLKGNNAFLEGARPIDVLRTRGSKDVIEALDATLAGSFA